MQVGLDKLRTVCPPTTYTFRPRDSLHKLELVDFSASGEFRSVLRKRLDSNEGRFARNRSTIYVKQVVESTGVPELNEHTEYL